jgi:type IV secretory system conjugative DNA transfer VirD4/TraG family protein
MLQSLSTLRAARRRFIGAVVIVVFAAVGIVAAPKTESYAAPDRLALTCGLFLVGLVAIVGITWSLRRYHDVQLLHRFAGSTGPMKDTLNFILQERRLMRRWRVALAAAAWAGYAAAILSYWPQFNVIEPFHSAFRFAGGACLALLMLQPLYVRTNIINCAYLHRYLRQQARHAGFLSPKKRLAIAACQLNLPKEAQFEAGGFTWELEDLYKNALVLGMPGSGKTMTVLNALTECLLAAKSDGLSTAGLILDPKASLFDPKQGKDLITPLCERLGRGGDLLILSADTWPTDADTNRSIAWNKFDSDADPVDVSSSLVTAMRLAGGVVNQETFFIDSARIFIRHAFALWRAALAPEPVSLQDIHRLCMENVEEPESYPWLIDGLAKLYQGQDAPSDVESACAYFSNEWRRMPDRQRGGVQSTVTQLVDDFSSEPIASMMSGRSTMRIGDMIDSGKILYVHMPLADRERVSRLICGLIKLEYQREILRRVVKSRPSFMIADEFQSVWVAGENHGDSDFFERSRESRHVNVVAAQNLSSFLKKTKNREEVMNFLGLCGVKIFLRNNELETNKFAASLFGERSEIIVSMSESAKVITGLSRNQTSYSRSTKSTRVVSPDEFTRLAIPQRGQAKRQFAQSIVHLGSRDTSLPLELNWPIHVLKS